MNRYMLFRSGYGATALEIEPDATAASYFGAAVITQGKSVGGLDERSIQGDIQL